MNSPVRELRRAQADVSAIAAWIHERSPRGAQAWLDAYDQILVSLSESAASYGKAAEHRECDFDIRQAFFKTRHGRVYRVIFVMADGEIYVLRLRGPGQASVTPADLDYDL